MAFVFKSQRKTTIGENTNTQLGPGQYLASESLIHKNKPKSSKAPPFLTSAKRKIDFSKKENIPGPGAYQQQIDLEIKSLLPKRTDTIYNNLEADDVSSARPLGFLIKDKRFHNELKEEVPGPGQYDNDPSSISQKRIKSSVSRISMRPKTAIKETQPSMPIPSKNKCFGFDVLDNGSVRLADDPLKFIKYEGEKFDSVGPGAYELSDKKNWSRGGTAWSKYKTKRNIMGHIEPKSKTANHSFDEQRTDRGEMLEKRKIEKEQLNKYMKEKAMIRKQLVEAYNNEQQLDIDKIIKNVN